MKFVKTLLACAALAAAAGAQAQVVTYTPGGPLGQFLTLNDSGLAASGSFAGATRSGGTVYSVDMPLADQPKGSGIATIGSFLAAGPASGQPATLTFTGGVKAVSFLWGSPDLFNVLTVTTTLGSQAFVASAGSSTPAGAISLNFAQSSGQQDFAQYVTFSALASSTILSLGFDNQPPQNAFETSNYSIAAVPEPGTYALMLAGLGVVGFIVRRRHWPGMTR